jgi:plastocyanin
MRRTMSRLCALLACLGAAAATVSGCGGEPAAVSVPDARLRVQLDEFRLVPQNFSVPAGRVRLTAQNVGRLTHNLVVESITDDPRKQIVYGQTDTAHPGDTVHEREPIVLRPGRYRIACTIANHENLGQYGTLTVK